MCLGEVGRVLRLVDERRAVVESSGRETIAVLDVVLAEGVVVAPGDVVVVMCPGFGGLGLLDSVMLLR